MVDTHVSASRWRLRRAACAARLALSNPHQATSTLGAGGEKTGHLKTKARFYLRIKARIWP